MTTMYLIRHAEAEGNIYRRCQGWYNSLITMTGYRQIEALRRRFENVPVDAVWSSDLFRTMTTAGAVYKPKGLELHTDPDLREIGCGVWEDVPWGELQWRERAALEVFLRAVEIDWSIEGGESYRGVMERTTRALRRIAAENEGKTVVVVSHGAAIRAALAGLDSGRAEQIRTVPQGENTAVTKLLFDGDRARVEYMNDSSHLAGLYSPEEQKRRNISLSQFVSTNLWFRPLDFQAEPELYRRARREAWETIHGTMKGYHGDAFFDDAAETARRDPRCVLVAMCGKEPAGVLQMAPERDAEAGVGRIPFFYMSPAYREKGMGVQLLGQAVSTFRPMDRQFLRLRCAPENLRARRFYERYGFSKVGAEPGGLGSLDVLEKFIGYQLNEPAKI